MAEIFDDWPEKYDRWFETPIGKLVREYERRLLLDMAGPGPQDHILDVGCGTGVFTRDLLEAGARVTGLELSLPMLRYAGRKAAGFPFRMVLGDMRFLPFEDDSFDKTISVTALEFLDDPRSGMAELLRVTRPGGLIAVATLNSLSSWAARRKDSAAKGHVIFKHAHFRSPAELAALLPIPAQVGTAVHFEKSEDPERAPDIESDGQARHLDTGAFVMARWRKPVA